MDKLLKDFAEQDGLSCEPFNSQAEEKTKEYYILNQVSKTVNEKERVVSTIAIPRGSRFDWCLIEKYVKDAEI
jgi:hypothetical protein